MESLARLLLFAVAVGGYTVLLVGVVNRTHAYGWNRKFVDLLTTSSAILLAAGLWPLAEFAAGPHYPSGWWRLPSAVVFAFGWSSLAIAAVAFTHNVWRCLHPERRGGLGHCSSEIIQFDQPADELLAPGLPLRLGTLPGNEVLAPRLVNMELLVPGLPTAFDGLTIAHLSDLHMSGRLTRAYFDRVVEVANSPSPDLVVLTGDIVECVGCLDWVDESLAHLTARQARLFVLGNHDVKADPVETRRRMVAAGFVDVGGRATTLELDRGPCMVAGNEMPWFPPPPDLTSVPTRQAAPDALRLALLHTPDHFHWAQQHGFHVALAGHNHGGQVRFPILGALLSPSIYGTRYARGVFRHGGTVMHVNPGTGTLSPIRWNCPPELNLLTLRVG